MKSIFSLLALVVLVSVGTVSATSESCGHQKGMLELFHELIETKVNNTFKSDLGLLVKAEVNRIVTGSIDERIQVKINKTLNVAFEDKVNVLIDNALADEPGKRDLKKCAVRS